MNIFTDFHHTDLYNSFKFLFENRLGHKVYRPIGMRWFTDGFWDIAKPYDNSVDTARQFLEPHNVPTDGTRPLNENLKDTVTFDEFLEMDFDVIIASIPDHWKTYTYLRDRFKPNAKVICHMGNRWENTDFGHVRNLMASVRNFRAPVENVIFYHQEFDLDIFQRSPVPKESKLITSFLNVPQAYETYPLWKEIQPLMPDYVFEEYGAQSVDGNLDHKGIATSMADSKFIWQVKPGGDGFGHVVHNAMAIGRVSIIRADDYKWTLAGDLLIPNTTCIDIQGLKPPQIVSTLKRHEDSASEMGEKLADMFYSKVDFENIAKRVENFLEVLV